MEYLGNDTYKFYLDDKDLILTKNELDLIIHQFNNNSKLHQTKQEISLFSKRKNSKNKKIKDLFEKYYNSTKTKTEVFNTIANELNITFKAVEKAYYKK